MQLKDLKIGDKLEICLKDKSNKNRSPYYSVKLENINNDGTVDIDLPMFGTQLFTFEINTVVQVSVTQEDGIYSFDGEILANNDKSPIPVMRAKPLGEMVKSQRRSYFRIKCNCNIKYRFLDQGLIDPENTEFKDAIIIDLSGGGMCILGEQKIEKNILLECVIMLEKDVEVKAICKAINSKEKDQSKKWRTGLEFYQISERSREKIINFVFQEQMKLRRKGLV